MNQQVGWNEVKTPVKGFVSQLKQVGVIEFPKFLGTRVMMMPFHLHDIESTIPYSLSRYVPVLKQLADMVPEHVRWFCNNASYLTIDEKRLTAGQIQRKPGKHVDGMYAGEIAGAWGGGGGGWGSTGNGMLVASNTDNLCSAWEGDFVGVPVGDGDCAHLEDQCTSDRQHDFKAGQVYWMDGLAVHESYAASHDVDRQFIRVSLPSASPWFEGYTENPLGIKPNGEILSERRI